MFSHLHVRKVATFECIATGGKHSSSKIKTNSNSETDFSLEAHQFTSRHFLAVNPDAFSSPDSLAGAPK